MPNPVPPSPQPAQSGLNADEITNIAKQIGDAQAQIDKYRTQSKNEDALALKYRQQYEALKHQADYLFSQYNRYSSAASDAQNQANILSQQANELVARHAWWGNPDELSAKSNYFQHQADALNYQANQIRENAYNIQSEYNADLSKANFHENNAKYANQQIQYFQNQIKSLNEQLHSK
jgi:chromosome segregation ATPase